MEIPDKSWLGAYLFYEEPFEPFLLQAVKPFVNEVLSGKLVEQFYFIRFWENGPHIRLRLKADTGKIDREVRPLVSDYFGDFFLRHPSKRKEEYLPDNLPENLRWYPNNSIRFVEYQPELPRYGGPVGICISERQFEASSLAVLAIIQESSDWNYDRALGAAIQLHLGFVKAFSMHLDEAMHFFSRIFSLWFSRSYVYEPNLSKEELEKRKKMTMEIFQLNFERQKNILVPFHEQCWQGLEGGLEFEQEWMNDWLGSMKDICEELLSAQKESQLEFPFQDPPDPDMGVPEAKWQLWAILESYVHMTNNRLGILNRDEAYLGFLLKKSLETIRR